MDKALKWAVAGNNKAAVRALLEGGADVGTISPEEFRLYSGGTYRGVSLDIGKMLVQHGFSHSEIVPYVVLDDVRAYLKEHKVEVRSPTHRSLHIRTDTMNISIHIERGRLRLKCGNISHVFGLGDPDYKKKICTFCIMSERFGRKAMEIING